MVYVKILDCKGKWEVWDEGEGCSLLYKICGV